MKKKSPMRNVLIIVVMLIAVLMIALLLNGLNSPKDISYTQLVEDINAGKVHSVYVSSYNVKIRYNDSSIRERDFPKRADATTNISSRIAFEEHIRELETAASSNPESTFIKPQLYFDNPASGNIWSTLIPIIGMLALGGLLLFMFRQSQGSNSKAMNFGKTKARLNQNIKVRFSDVAGADEEKEELREVVEFLKAPKKFTDVGARIPKGVLLVGPPGTGKTLFAKAVAGEANVPFFSISGSDFVEMFVGVGASRVRDLFDQAKHNMPCIIFIDEIDAVGRQRGAGLGGGHDEREQTLNQLLVQMDGFDASDDVIIIAATNRADILDPALLRPGRFDRQIYVNIPDVRGREAIFKVHSRNKPLAGDINFNTLARLTSGFTGADIANLLNEAAILAARANRNVIIMKDIYEGINKVTIGPQKKSRVVTETDKRITSYHEAGHAIVAKILDGCDDVQEVSIIPRGMAAGYTLTRPDNDDNHVSKNKLLDIISMMLGGRAAEELVIKDISTGASSDIKRATSIAKNMVTEWGMTSSLGNSFWGSGEHEVFLGRDFQAQHSYSEQVAGMIDSEIRAIIDSAYSKALQILKDNRSILDNMVRLLYDRETIYADEVNMLFEGKDVSEIIEYIQEKDRKIDMMRIENLIVEEKPKDIIVAADPNSDEKQENQIVENNDNNTVQQIDNSGSDNNNGDNENSDDVTKKDKN